MEPLQLSDDLGRIVIPRKLCEAFGWRGRDRLSIQPAPDSKIRPEHPRCCLCCGEPDTLWPAAQEYICSDRLSQAIRLGL